MFTTYALYRPSHNKIYVGYSSNIHNRIIAHNEWDKKGFTKKFRPWIIVYTESFQTKKEAMARENQLKSAKGREFIWKIVNEKFKSSPSLNP